MSYENWIKDLKVGSKVIVANNYGEKITTVTKITPKGFIKVESGKMFNPDGGERGGSNWNYTSLLQLTDDILLKFKKKELISQCEEIRFSELNTEQLEQILLITSKIVK